MERIRLGGERGPEVSRLACGLWRLHTLELRRAADFLVSAADKGVTLFDIAAIYGRGEAERLLGRVFTREKSLRARMILQTKCGNLISQDGMRYYDFSREAILTSVEDSLVRMGTDYLDILLLHRPDALYEPEEVAAAFAELHQRGKVRYFGVSNQNPGQIQLLKRYLTVPLITNQLQFGLAHADLAVRNLYANTDAFPEHNLEDGLMDYCRLNDITIQAWSPLQYGDSAGTFLNHPDFPVVNRTLREMSRKYGVQPSAMAIAWILRHPAGIVPVLGTLNQEHLAELLQALSVSLERMDWYTLLTAAGYKVR